MNRYGKTKQSFQDILKNVVNNKVKVNSEPDKKIYEVNTGKGNLTILEKTNEIIDNKTVSKFTSHLDDSGFPFSNIREFLLCHCGAKINLKSQKVYRCHICHNVTCSACSFVWDSKQIAFCHNLRCTIIGRLYQLFYYFFKAIKISCFLVFGFDNKKTVPAQQIERVNAENLNSVENDENDIREIIKRLNNNK